MNETQILLLLRKMLKGETVRLSSEAVSRIQATCSARPSDMFQRALNELRENKFLYHYSVPFDSDECGEWLCDYVEYWIEPARKDTRD